MNNIQPVDKQQCGEIKDSTGERKPSGGEQSRSTLKGEKPRRKVQLNAVKYIFMGKQRGWSYVGKAQDVYAWKKSGK